MAIVVAIVSATLAGGSGARTAPVRSAADPAPRVVVKRPVQVRRRNPRKSLAPVLKRQRGKLERRKHEPEKEKEIPASHELVPSQAPEPVGVPEPSATPEVAPPPTPPGVEFGM
jgi:hypothetical protein